MSVDRLRRKLDEIVHQNPRWDGKVARLEVTDVTIDAVELRALVSARTPTQSWDLRCEVREKFLEFLQALPREVAADANEGAAPTTPPRADQRTSSPVVSGSATGNAQPPTAGHESGHPAAGRVSRYGAR